MAVERTVDRDAWAAVVQELIDRETRGKKLPFARLVGVDATTVSRWLRREVAVSDDSVRAVARAIKHPPMDLLVKAGYYTPADIPPPRAADPNDDPVIQAIMADPNWTEEQRSELVEKQLKQMEEDQKRRLAEYEQLVRLAGRTREAS